MHIYFQRSAQNYTIYMFVTFMKAGRLNIKDQITVQWKAKPKSSKARIW